MKSSEQTIYRARRTWTTLIAAEVLAFLLCYWFFGGNAFFLLGPFFLYNFVIFMFPFWYAILYAYGTPSHGPKFQQLRRLTEKIFPHETRLNLRVVDNEFANVLILAHGNTLWLTTSTTFLELFSEPELVQLLEEVRKLHSLGRIQSSTLWSALQFCMPLGIWGHNRGTELIFFSPNLQVGWQKLTFRVFHWQTDRAAQAQTALVPCLFYPALTKYNPASYFSAYNYLRERLITSLKTPEDDFYGQQRDAHF